MIISSIELNNFRNFGKAKIDFATDKEKNITVILGQNTFGKTTLVKAFIWCLYRENKFSNAVLLNADVASKMAVNTEIDVSVTIEFMHEESFYKVKTVETYRKTPKNEVVSMGRPRTSMVQQDRERGSLNIPSTAVENTIEDILRPELKDYFFFDGETNTIDAVSKKRNLENAVTNIVGLEQIEWLRDTFDPAQKLGVYTLLSNELDVGEQNELKFEELKKQIEDYQEEIEKINIEIDNDMKEKGKIESQIAEKRSLLDANNDVKQLKTDYDSLKQEISKNTERREKNFGNMIRTFNEGLAFVSPCFSASFKKNDLEELLRYSSFDSENSYKGISEEAVKHLVERGRCLCGAVIENGNDAYRHLMEAVQHMEPHDYGKYVTDFLRAEKSNSISCQTIVDGIERTANAVTDAIEDIENQRNRLKKINEQLIGREDVGGIQEDRLRLERSLGAKDYAIEANQKRLARVNEELAVCESRIKQYSSSSDKNAFTKLCLEYVSSIYQLAEGRCKRERGRIRELLEESANGIFQEMYHGNRKIVIDSNFKADTIVVQDGNDTQLDKSTGLGTVMNYAFVAGLLKLAKNYRPEADETTIDEEEREPYPLVMDAPFSNTDDVHIKGICSALPRCCDQVIMFVMEKDFNYAKEAIVEKIGKLYRLNKRTETSASVEPEVY